MSNEGKGAQTARVTSTIVDPAGKTVAKTVSAPVAIGEVADHAFEQQIVVKSPALWSLEQRNLYKLVTEVDAGGAITDRYETPFGIRTCTFDAEKGFFLNGKSVKLKGTCNHQDHAGVGAALPDAVQYFRVRKLQEMGCNALRTSHNPPTPELLDAADELGMLVFDETRMMSSNPEGLSQLANLVRRDRNHPSVFLWSLGNEEGMAGTDKGFLILSEMKALVEQHDDSRLVSMAPNGGGNMGKFGFAALDVQGYNYADPAADAFHKANPKIPVMGTEQVSAVATRGIYVMDPQHGYVGSYDPYTTSGPRLLRGLVEFLQRAPVAGRRLHLDGLRLSRRAVAVRVAEHQLAVRHHRHLRLSQGQLLLFPVVVDSRSRCCTCSRTGTGRGWKGRRSRSGCTPIWTAWSCSSTARAWARRT